MNIKRISKYLVFAVFILATCAPVPGIPPLGDWTREADFPGTPRGGAFCFTIGNMAYVGMGYGTTSTGVSYQQDCWAFNGDAWVAIKDFPGVLRERAVAFSINGKGYVGTGYNRDLTDPEMKDFWQYDPATNEWTQLNDFGGNARYNAIGFADATNGYVGIGYDGSYYNDYWKYDPTNDTWEKFIEIGERKQSATLVTINDKFYILGGTNNGQLSYDSWQFEPRAQLARQWTKITPNPSNAYFGTYKLAVQRYDAVGFSQDGKGYLATGSNPGALSTIFQFDITAGTWTQMTNFERAPRSKAVAFVVNNKIYVGTGYNSTLYFDDMMNFDPLK